MAYSDQEKNRQYYRDYKALNSERLKFHERKRRREWRIRLLEIVGNNKCKDCGEKDFRVLEFDHLGDEKKEANVASFIGRNWVKALAEAMKCEVVCANCHKIRTFERFPKLEEPKAKWTRWSKTHCPRGHLKTSENRKAVKGRNTTVCTLCLKERSAEYNEKKRKKKNR